MMAAWDLKQSLFFNSSGVHTHQLHNLIIYVLNLRQVLAKSLRLMRAWCFCRSDFLLRLGTGWHWCQVSSPHCCFLLNRLGTGWHCCICVLGRGDTCVGIVMERGCCLSSVDDQYSRIRLICVAGICNEKWQYASAVELGRLVLLSIVGHIPLALKLIIWLSFILKKLNAYMHGWVGAAWMIRCCWMIRCFLHFFRLLILLDSSDSWSLFSVMCLSLLHMTLMTCCAWVLALCLLFYIYVII